MTLNHGPYLNYEVGSYTLGAEIAAMNNNTGPAFVASTSVCPVDGDVDFVSFGIIFDNNGGSVFVLPVGPVDILTIEFVTESTQILAGPVPTSPIEIVWDNSCSSINSVNHSGLATNLILHNFEVELVPTN
jgi:hypothetical protein